MTQAKRRTMTLAMTQAGRMMMMSAGTQDDDVSNYMGQMSDGSWTDVRRKSDVERVELSRRCDDGGRRRYTAAMAQVGR
ncbi:unnamed protein product [Sphagnum troendelagicum]|uniref:Uncharacterized protein n=1 Tax=Sphagnum troendelagicum TaxID=128251 RepID=A0ABP0TAA1_9BRYO